VADVVNDLTLEGDVIVFLGKNVRPSAKKLVVVFSRICTIEESHKY